MSTMAQPERVTQQRVIALFRDELQYDYLGDWSARDSNRNVEQGLLGDWLTRRGYAQAQISAALHRLRTEADHPARSRRPARGCGSQGHQEYPPQRLSADRHSTHCGAGVGGDGGDPAVRHQQAGLDPQLRNIRLNTELAKKPPECLEYIVVHELVHLREPTHSDRFVALMNQLMPHWRDHREMMNRLPVRYEGCSSARPL